MRRARPHHIHEPTPRWLDAGWASLALSIVVICGSADVAGAAVPNAVARHVATFGSDVLGGDCVDPKRPCATVQHAVDVAAAGDRVLVAAGTYHEAADTSVDLPTIVAVSGGWNRTFRTQSGTSTLDATGRSSPDGFGEVFRPLHPGDDVTMNRLVLTGGHGQGGGVTVTGGQVSISQSVLRGNRGASGGAINNQSGTVSVTDSQISDNTAADQAAGIFNVRGTVNLINVTVSGNRVDPGRFDGAAASNLLGSMTISRSTIVGNAAREGGAIRNGGTLTLIDSLVRANTASTTGGAIMAVGGGVTVLRSAIIGNQAGTDGGGHYGFGGFDTTFTNTTISGNNAIRGGGLWLQGGDITLASSSVTRNSATEGGGLHRFGRFIIQNTLIADNTASTGPDCFGTGGAIQSNGYNLMSNTSDCGYMPDIGDLVNMDARLGPVVAGVQTLNPVSPAINAGNPAAPGTGGTACPDTDQRGVTRTARCDIGAFER